MEGCSVRVMQPEDGIKGRGRHRAHVTPTAGQAVDCVVDIFQATPDLGIVGLVVLAAGLVPIVAHWTIS